MQTVGIPRALLYHRYGKFWQTYLGELGLRVKVSGATTKRTVELGLGKVSSEVCLPIKIIAGHVEELKNEVDFLFMPQLVWMGDHLYACPKMIGIPDVARLTMPASCRVVAPEIKGNFMLPHLRAGVAMTRNPARTLRAWHRSASLLRHDPPAPTFPADQRKIAIISHFYNLEDPYVAQDIIVTFTKAGMRVYTKEDLPAAELARADGPAASVRWVYERELYNAFRYYSGKVDGICAVVSFGCGPDSLIVEIMQREAKTRNVPFTQLVVDEHTGKAGIVTRLEAFMETISRRPTARMAGATA